LAIYNLNHNIKTESELEATTVYCSNGTHNPATNHPESKCWQLHTEQKKTKKTSKKQAKAAVNGNDTDNESSVPSDGCFLGISKQEAFSAHSKMTMFLDSRCSDHMFPKKEYFTGYKSMSLEIEISNGKSLRVEGSGYVQINNGHGSSLKIRALHVPRIVQPLISSGRLFCKGCVVQKPDLSSDLNSPKFVVVDLHSDSIILHGEVANNVFVLDGYPISSRVNLY
ncbi:uncharacterized protein VP01_3373g3, partial [Puccinia sorghi]